MEGLERIFDYVGKRDRPVNENFEVKALCPAHDFLFSVFDKYKTVKDDVSVADTIQNFLKVRMARHNMWCELFQIYKAKPEYNFNDVKVIDFISDNFEVLGIKTEEVPLEIANKTPDVLLYNRETNILYISDVAVTRDIGATIRNKYLKYLPISNFFQSKNIQVMQLHAVFKEDMQNAKQVIKTMEDNGIINTPGKELFTYISYVALANRLMNEIPSHCADIEGFSIMLSQNDSKDKNKLDSGINIDLSGLDELEEEIPKMSIKEIVEMVKEVTENNYMTFFDQDYQEADNAFNKLLNRTNEDLSKELYPNEKEDYIKYDAPKSTLKVVHNSKFVEEKTNYDLLLQYISDLHTSDTKEISEFILSVLPTTSQVETMRKIYYNSHNKKADSSDKVKNVYGPYQYKNMRQFDDNLNFCNYRHQLTKGKKNVNVKKPPKMISPDEHYSCIRITNEQIQYLGSLSDKPSFLDDSWLTSSSAEIDNTIREKGIYDYVRKTNGVQLANALSMLFHRVNHLSADLSTKDNVFIAPNSSFICIIPGNHAPVTKAQCDLPLMFITRCKKDVSQSICIEYEYKCETEEYYYYASKLCRLPLSKMANWANAGERLTASASYILSNCDNIEAAKVEVVGIQSMMLLDEHQKTSMLLELLKYVAYMPFSDLSRLSYLIKDKFDIMLKTRLDVWIIHKLKSFMKALSKVDEIKAKKPSIKMFNGDVIRDSLGMKMSLPSFVDHNLRHDCIEKYIEEVNMICILRAKHLYGGQFMHESAVSTVKWNNEYEEEVKKYKTWATNGEQPLEDPNDDNIYDYPFDAKFCFSRDAIIHATKWFISNTVVDKAKVRSEINRSAVNDFVHNNCSLRGCTKEREKMKTSVDYHTTSLEACLEMYREGNYDDLSAKMHVYARVVLKNGFIMTFSMSPKEQRFNGRPIATPNLPTKAALTCVEKPEGCLGKFLDNNIVVEGKHKLSAISETYRSFIGASALKGYRFVSQMTEDQSKFSENDNVRKYIPYINCNNFIDENIRRMQKTYINKLNDRIHIIKQMPKEIQDNLELKKWQVDEHSVKIIIGWPQGMLNFISTNIHCIADRWITHIYNLAYPEEPVMTRGLVHSDDSWAAIAYNNMNDYKRFCVFRMYAKKLFCLKLNDKKFYASKLIGEMVSNYNINGNVHCSVAKIIANSFGNMKFINWVIDVYSQISTIQQSYRNGANLPTIIMLNTILKQQLIRAYNFSKKFREVMDYLPVELGGYPSSSAFELAVTGVISHNNELALMVQRASKTDMAKVIMRVLRMSMIYNRLNQDVDKFVKDINMKLGEYNEVTPEESDASYESLTIPTRLELFSCIKHKMPKTTKITKTLEALKSIPFESDGLEMVITKPYTLAESLGHLKSQTGTLLYSLAAEKYTQNTRTLASSQALQASKKVVRICGFRTMTYEELYNYILSLDLIPEGDPRTIQLSLSDDSNIANMCRIIVKNAELNAMNTDKRKVITKMPTYDDPNNTISSLNDILLLIVDQAKVDEVSYYSKYSRRDQPIDVVISDAKIIKTRFKVLFDCYNVKKACNLIVQNNLQRIKSRLWIQARMCSDSVEEFLCYLYGNTINSKQNYKIEVKYSYINKNTLDSQAVNSMFTIKLLDRLYFEKFKIESIQGLTPIEFFDKIEYDKLNVDDFLKYAILYKLYKFDDKFLKKFDDSKQYMQKYIKAQKKQVNNYGKLVNYVGDFDVYVRFGKTVIRIIGEPCNIKLISSTNTVNEILMCMMIFVQRNFPYYRYNNPYIWYNSKFWDNKDITRCSDLYLVGVSRVCTIIQTKETVNSLAITINKNMRMIEVALPAEECTYDVDESLRIVYKKQGKHTNRIGTVRHDMQCPLVDNIVLEPDYVRGFMNTELLKHKIIINITMGRYYSNSQEQLQALLDTADDSCHAYPLVMVIAQFANKFKDSGLITLPEDEPECEMEEYNIEYCEVDKFINKFDEVEPENLNALVSEFTEIENERIGTVYKHKDIARVICSMLTYSEDNVDFSDMLKFMFSDTEFKNNMYNLCVNPDKSDAKIEILQTAINMSRIVSVDRDISCFLLSNRFDHGSYWYTFDIKEFFNTLDNFKLPDPKYVKMAIRMRDLITEMLFEKSANNATAQDFAYALVDKPLIWE